MWINFVLLDDFGVSALSHGFKLRMSGTKIMNFVPNGDDSPKNFSDVFGKVVVRMEMDDGGWVMGNRGLGSYWFVHLDLERNRVISFIPPVLVKGMKEMEGQLNDPMNIKDIYEMDLL